MRVLRWSTTGLLVVALAGCSGDEGAPTEGATPTVARVDVTPALDTMRALDATLQLSAVARDAEGNVLPDETFTWSSSEPEVISVDASGLVTARDRGTATVRATARGVTGQADLAVQIADRLSPDEARAVADRFAEAATLGLNGGLGDLANRGASAPPTDIEITFDITDSCPIDGSINVAGTLVGTIDGPSHSADLELDATAAADDCTFEHDGTTFVVFTEVDAPVTITGAVDIVEREGSALLEIAGVVFWEADDGRSDRCEIDITVTWSSEDGHTVSGSVCGEEIGD